MKLKYRSFVAPYDKGCINVFSDSIHFIPYNKRTQDFEYDKAVKLPYLGAFIDDFYPEVQCERISRDNKAAFCTK